MRTLTHTLKAGEAAAGRQIVIGTENDIADREGSPVVRSVMQLGVNGCLPYIYNTRMRIIRNILAYTQPENREDRLGSVAVVQTEYSPMTALER